MAPSAATTVSPRDIPVSVIQLTEDQAMYFAGDMSFDEVDRDLAYIDHVMNTWLAWRNWVVKNGEKK